MTGKPSPDAFRENWNASDLPFWKKVRTVLRNNAKKVATAQHCCGHHGDPGC